MYEHENMETISKPNPVDPASTSKFLYEKSKLIPYNDLAKYYLQQTGYDLNGYLKSQAQDIITDAVKKSLGKILKPKVMGLISVIIDGIGVVSAIDTAMTAVKLGAAIHNVWKKGGKNLKVVTKNYEWLSGSGNHSSYYSEIEYYVA